MPRLVYRNSDGNLETLNPEDSVSVQLAKNGKPITESESKASIGSLISSRYEGLSAQAILPLSTGDYIEVFIANETDTSDVTVTDINVTIIPA